jgi:alpha-L-rhamnosidase
MYRTVGGIESDGPGFKKITLHPKSGPGLDHASAKLESIRGTIASEWRTEKDSTAMKFIVPPNTTATVYLPTKDAAKVSESGKPIAEAKGVKFLWAEGDTSAYQLMSGTYEFSMPTH